MRIHRHAELLSESMLTCKEIECSLGAVREYLGEHVLGTIKRGEIKVIPYLDTPDGRIGWQRTCIVTDGGRVVAFCDEIPPHEASEGDT